MKKNKIIMNKDQFEQFVLDAPEKTERAQKIAHHYLDYFDAYQKGKRVHWNWSAFFAPFVPWFLYRKMYFMGFALHGIVLQAFKLAVFIANKTEDPAFWEIPFSIGVILLICLYLGLIGDQLYLEHANRKIKQHKIKGGTNKWLFIIMLLINVIINYVIL